MWGRTNDGREIVRSPFCVNKVEKCIDTDDTVCYNCIIVSSTVITVFTGKEEQHDIAGLKE